MLTVARLRRDRQRFCCQCEADGLKSADGAAASGFYDRPDVGIELGAPFGAEAVGDFAEHDAGPQGSLGAVVGRRNLAIGDEDEQVAADFLDHTLEFAAGLVRRLKGHEVVEGCVEPRGISLQRRVGEPWPSLTDAAGAPEQVT